MSAVDPAARAVVVVGAGAAGLLAALTVRERAPDARVTVLAHGDAAEGAAVATTPALLPLLHRYLPVEVHRFAAALRPLPALGTWVGELPLPYAAGDVADALAHDGDLGRASLAAMLMARERAPVARVAGALHGVPDAAFGWLLDLPPLLAHLEALARATGVRLEARPLARIEAHEARIEALVLEDGARLEAELFVDATGPAALLAGETLGLAARPLELGGDVLLTALARHEGPLRPGATALALTHGPAWIVPTRRGRHLAHLVAARDADAAARELTARFALAPGAVTRTLGAAAYHRAGADAGNVVAVGLTVARLAPLHALDGLPAQLDLLLARLAPGADPATERARARVVANTAARVAWFALQHERLAALDTALWRELGERATRLSAPARAELHDAGLSAPRRGPGDTPDDRADALLIALGERPTAPLGPTVDRAGWDELGALREAVVAAALPVPDGVASLLLDEHLLDGLVGGQASWLAAPARARAAAHPPRGRGPDALASWAATANLQARFPAEIRGGDPSFLTSPAADFGKYLRKVPLAALTPRDQEQLAACLRELSRRGVPVTLRGTGHSSGGQTLTDDGVVVDLRRLRRVVRDDPGAERVTVEGGLTFDDLQLHLHPQGRWLPVLTMNWRVSVAGSLAVGGFGDRSHLLGLQTRQVRGLTIMTVDGERHAVGPGEPLFDWSLAGRGQLGAIVEATLTTVRRPTGVAARVIRWASFRDYLEDAVRASLDARLDVFRGRAFWADGTVRGAIGHACGLPPSAPFPALAGLRGRPAERVDAFDYFERSRRPPDAHWLPATPAVELVLPLDPDDLDAGALLLEAVRERVLAAGLGPHVPLGTALMVLPTAGHTPLCPLPATPFALMVAVRPELEAATVPRFLPALEALAGFGLDAGGKLYLVGVEPRGEAQLVRQLGAERLARWRALKREHDPGGLLNPGIL